MCCAAWGDWAAARRCSWVVVEIVRLGGAEALEELAEAFVRRQAAQRVRYTELRYSPHEFLAAESRVIGGDESGDGGDESGDGGDSSGGGGGGGALGAPRTAADVVDAVTRGLRRGEAAAATAAAGASGECVVRQILCCVASRPDWATDVVSLAASARGGTAGVVGVDIAAGEHHFPTPSSPRRVTFADDVENDPNRTEEVSWVVGLGWMAGGARISHR